MSRVSAARQCLLKNNIQVGSRGRREEEVDVGRGVGSECDGNRKYVVEILNE